MTNTQPTGEERKRQITAYFNATADTYDQVGFTFVVPVAARLVELAQLLPGERVLDLATGTGWVALGAAKAVGPSGRVVATDLAAEMLGPARSKAALAGLGNLEFDTGDAEAPSFPDDAFDAVLCASAIFFLTDPDAALQQWRRVTRPGGRVLFSVFSSGLLGPLLDLFDAHIQPFIPELPPRVRFNAGWCERLLTYRGGTLRGPGERGAVRLFRARRRRLVDGAMRRPPTGPEGAGSQRSATGRLPDGLSDRCRTPQDARGHPRRDARDLRLGPRTSSVDSS